MKWRIGFVDDNGGVWMWESPTTQALRKHGYAAGAVKDAKTGITTYTLHRQSIKPDESAFPIIFETEDLDELNRYINLLLPPMESEG